VRHRPEAGHTGIDVIVERDRRLVWWRRASLDQHSATLATSTHRSTSLTFATIVSFLWCIRSPVRNPPPGRPT